MTAQQQAFKAYYSSLSDADLMKIAVNKRSFLEVAQEALVDELRGRNLVPSEPSPSADHRTGEPHPGFLARIARKLRG